MREKIKKRRYFGVVAATIGIIIFIYLWIVWGDRGIYADSTGTAGYTTTLEIVLAVVGIVLIILSVLALLGGKRK